MESKKIILAISGSIAAYKAAVLTRLLIKSGAELRVIMTENAKAFISPLTLSTLSKNEVFTSVIDEESWNNHVELGLWADAMIIAPATANTLAKMAHGICDNIVSAVYLSAKCPVFFAPAMDLDMWQHPSTQKNIQLLQTYGDRLIDVAEGELASGLVGKGRMAEPEEILNILEEFFNKKKELAGKRVMITAGPSYEKIDPVRFIGNRSSGKMGVALAEVCAEKGAHVKLILGPSGLNPNHINIHCHRVESAEEMYQKAVEEHAQADICIFAAAVADYRPKQVARQKLKKSDHDLSIELERTKDIAYELGKNKQKHQLHIGFALETDNERTNASNKLKKKNFDLIVLNSLNDKGAGFQHDTNKVTLISSKEEIAFDLKTKSEVALDIINTIIKNYV